MILRGFLIAIVFSFAQQCYAQTIPAFLPLRYEENYSFLKNDTTGNWYKKLKYATFSKNNNTYVSFGGEVRFQYFWFKNEEWGNGSTDNDGYVLARYLIHADFHVGKIIRTFIQLQSSLTNGKIVSSPVEENPLEVHQAFVDIKLMTKLKKYLLLRIGRQELLYGSQRLVSVRDLPNNRQAFDAVKSVYSFKNYRIDLFYGHYVAAKKGIFNDGFNQHTKLWGGYISGGKIPVVENIDLYYLGLWKDKSAFDIGIAKELRHSIGTRVWGKKNNLRYDIEAVKQFGNFGTLKISAWTFSINSGYKFKTLKFKPEFGIKAELISGNKNATDNKLQTFNPLFPKGAYFGLAALIGPSNLSDIHPSVTLEITKKVTLNFDYDAFWRYSIIDGIYAPNVSLIYSGKNVAGKFIGSQYATDFTYMPNNFLYLRAEFTCFTPGEFLKAVTPGKNVLFTGFTAQVKF